MRRKFILTEDRLGLTKGTKVYEYTGATYGLDTDDMWRTGVPHSAVTLDEDGCTPFITIPVYDLEEI